MFLTIKVTIFFGGGEEHPATILFNNNWHKSHITTVKSMSLSIMIQLEHSTWRMALVRVISVCRSFPNMKERYCFLFGADIRRMIRMRSLLSIKLIFWEKALMCLHNNLEAKVREVKVFWIIIGLLGIHIAFWIGLFLSKIMQLSILLGLEIRRILCTLVGG